MVMSLYHRFRLFLLRMCSWLGNCSFSRWIRRVFSGLWLYIMKVCLGLGVPLLRHITKGRGGRRDFGAGEEKRTSDESLSEDAGSLTEDEDTGGADIPAQEPERDSPCALDETSPDVYSCEYDSTWDTDTDTDTDTDDSQDQRPSGAEAQGERSEWGAYRLSQVKRHSYTFQRFQAAAKDVQNYRHDYPIKPFRKWNYQDNETTDEYPNLDFYLGKRPSSPDDVYINEFHTSWRGEYDRLESVHSYIQWLFPLQEPGVNFEASTLTKEEIEEFRQNDVAKKHLLESYKLMLDFYGIELCDERTGKVKRALNWFDRFTNLNRRTHNNLRITRILKSLGTLGFRHYQAPLVQFFLVETLVNGELPKVKDSVLNYFLFTVLDKKQRRSLLEFAYLNFDKREEFVWCPLKIQRKWAKQNRTQSIHKDPPL